MRNDWNNLLCHCMDKLLCNKHRDSNVELLRIVSMILVLVSHASYTSLEPPSQEDIKLSLDSSFLRGMSESLSKVCVNVFILISGWYGIRIKVNRFVELVFQALFISICMYFVMRILGLTRAISMNEWIELLLFKHVGYWFVRAYIILFLFSPVLNIFVQNTNRKQLKFFLVAFFSVQIIYGFYNYGGWYAGGYSPLSFMGLYVLARYMRLYPSKFTQLHKYSDLFLYFVLSIITAVCSLSLTFFFNKGGTVLLLYSSPLVILSSVYFFLFFTKFSFHSQFINWVATSCFAVYLVHTTPYILHSYYMDIVSYWYETELRTPFLLHTSGLVVLFFAFSICFDQFRILIWKMFSRLLDTFRMG